MNPLLPDISPAFREEVRSKLVTIAFSKRKIHPDKKDLLTSKVQAMETKVYQRATSKREYSVFIKRCMNHLASEKVKNTPSASLKAVKAKLAERNASIPLSQHLKQHSQTSTASEQRRKLLGRHLHGDMKVKYLIEAVQPSGGRRRSGSQRNAPLWWQTS